MSINQILSNAISGLNTAQASMRVASTNISNVNTPGYARKVVEQESLIVGGQPAGVQIAEVRRVVDAFLQRELRTVSADSERYRAMSTLHDRLQSLLGDPTSTGSLAGRLDTAFAKLSALPGDPASLTRRIAAVDSLQSFGNEVSRLAQQVQSLRGEADRSIVEQIADVNQAILRVQMLNREIMRESVMGRDVGPLEDQRDQAVAEIAKVIDIRTYPLSDSNGIGIATASGVSLLDDAARKLVYTPPGMVSAATQFSPITVNRVDPSTGAVAATGVTLDDRVRGGSLRGLLDMRDRELPGIAAELGELAARFTDEVNAVHNASTTVPPPASLSGRNSGLAATDAHGFTGQATFYVFDAANAVLDSVTIDFDSLPPGATLGDVITAVNTALGTNGTLSLTNGVMSFAAGTAPGATGVAIEQGTPPAARGGRGFSHFFGMNDLLQGAEASHHDTGLVGTDVHGFTGQTTLRLRSPGNETVVEYIVDFDAAPLSTAGATMTDVLAQLNGSALGSYLTFSLDGDGALVATPAAGYESYRLETFADTSDRAGTGATFSDMFGVGTRYRAEAALDLSVRADIAADPAKLALGRIDAAGTPALTMSDGRGALALQDLALQAVSFGAAGGLPATSTSFATYLAEILSSIGRDAAATADLQADREALQTELQGRLDDITGVNLDEELATMIVLQNAYNASARMMTTAREMYDVLLQI